MLYLTVNLKSLDYKDFGEYETFFQPVKKLEFDITDFPEGFELKTKNMDSSDKQRNIGEYSDKDYTLTAGIVYEDESTELNSVKLKFTIDNMITYIELSIDCTKTIDKMGVDLILQVIKQLMDNKTQSYVFNINNVEYSVFFDIHAMSTQEAYTGFGSANVSWHDNSLKEHKWLLTWTTNQRENYEALANYCTILDKLADSTMEHFFVTYINTVFDSVGVSKSLAN